MANDLMTIARPDTAALIFVEGGSDDIVSRIEEEARSIIADASTTKGRKAIASNAAKVARSKTYLDRLGKDLVAGLKKQTQAVDAERREMRNRLDALKVEVRKPLTDFEVAEDERKQEIRIRIGSIQQEIPIGSDAIMSRRAIVEKIAIDDSWGDYAPQAAMAKDAELHRLRGAYDSALEFERAEAERKAAEVRAKAEREERIAKDAAEAARLEAERKAAKAAEEVRRKQVDKARKAENKRLQAEREAAAIALSKERALIEAQRAAIEAERRQKQAEENAKRQAEQAADAARQEAELAAMQRRESEEREAAAAAAEARRKAENKAHRSKVNSAALGALQNECGLSFDDAKAVVVAIAGGKIPRVSINY